MIRTNRNPQVSLTQKHPPGEHKVMVPCLSAQGGPGAQLETSVSGTASLACLILGITWPLDDLQTLRCLFQGQIYS